MDKNNLKSYLYAIIVAMGPLSFGLTMGFTSPAISEWTGSKKTKYQNWDVFEGVSSAAITWFNAIASLFGCLGPFLVEKLIKMLKNLLTGRVSAVLALLFHLHFLCSQLTDGLPIRCQEEKGLLFIKILQKTYMIERCFRK